MGGREGEGDMRGRWGMSERGEEDKGGGVEVEERKVTNRKATRGGKEARDPDRQAGGPASKPRAEQGGQAEDQSCLPSAWVSSTEITHGMNHL